MDDTGISSGVIGGIVGGMAGMYFMYRASRQPWKPEMAAKVKVTETFDTPFSADELLSWIPGFAAYHLYQIEEKDVVPGRIVLSSKPGGNDWGWFYPIEVTPLPGGGTRIQVGIMSRGSQWGPAVKKALRQFITRLQNTLAQASAPQNPWAAAQMPPPQAPAP